MNKLKEYIINVLDEDETSVKDMKWPSLKIGKWLFITAAFLSPFLACILGATFMNVNSKEFVMLVIPLLMNWGIFLCWLLYQLGNILQISRKQMVAYTICIVVVAVSTTLAVNINIKSKSKVNPDLEEYWNRFSSYSDQELLKEYLFFMENDTDRVCKALVIPKNTLLRLIDGTSTATRYGSTNIRHAFALSLCFGKDFTLSNGKYSDNFLFDSLSNKHLNLLWEK